MGRHPLVSYGISEMPSVGPTFQVALRFEAPMRSCRARPQVKDAYTVVRAKFLYESSFLGWDATDDWGT